MKTTLFRPKFSSLIMVYNEFTKLIAVDKQQSHSIDVFKNNKH